MPKIFLSYRRDDSAGYAGRIAEQLHQTFGDDRVFRDLEDIHPGDDFVEQIERSVGGCDVLVALIGPRWLGAADATGKGWMTRMILPGWRLPAPWQEKSA